MQNPSTHDPPGPPDHQPTGPSDHENVDIDVDDPLDESLGEYPTIDDYFRSVLEELVDRDARWLLDCLDMTRVRRRFEDNGRHAYHCVQGRIYRTTC